MKNSNELRIEQQQFCDYCGKKFSIVGDSISTLEGYNPKDYKVFYAEDTCIISGVRELQDTWWGKVITFFGGELLVNNSWSGSRVTKLPNKDKLFPSGCSDERTSRLNINNDNPDVIIVYLGTNDWAYGVQVKQETYLLEEDMYDYEVFEIAYESMIKKIKYNYPGSEIWCCTLSETYMKNDDRFKFPYKYAGNHIEEYNDVICKITQHEKCKLVDLYSNHMPYDSIDGSHPTADGMMTIATEVIKEIKNDRK